MEGVRELLAKIKQKQAIMVASTMILTELLFDKMPQAEAEFFSIQGLSNVVFLPVDMAIARLAGNIRSYYRDTGKISVPDALHLATAIYGGCERFYTFDEGKKGDHGMLKLGDRVANHPLVVTKPCSINKSLPGIDAE